MIKRGILIFFGGLWVQVCVRAYTWGVHQGTRQFQHEQGFPRAGWEWGFSAVGISLRFASRHNYVTDGGVSLRFRAMRYFS